jgi:hypothetical protein
VSVYVDIPVLGGSPYWSDPVATFADLPTGQFVGEIRLTVDTMNGYYWDGSSWKAAWDEGAVGGPDSAVVGEIVLFDSTTGRLIKSATGSGFVRTTAGVYATQSAISLTADISGVLPVANGGTNASATLNNNRVMKSSSGTIIEAAAITASRALISDANGIPTHSAVTGTELGYVSGVTSGIQTQFSGVTTALAGKEPTIAAGTASQYWRGDKSWQTLNSAALVTVTGGTAAAVGTIGEVLTASTAANTTTGVGATGTYGSVVSLALTAGSWIVEGRAGFNENGATLTTGIQVGVSTSATGSGLSEFDTQLAPYLISSTSDAILSAPGIVVDTTGTTCYLNTKFWYTSGTPRHRGYLIARRIR